MNTSKGWICLYRDLLDDPIWLCSTNEQKVILVTLLLMANHDSNQWEWNGKKFEVQAGQFITSLPSIAKRAGKGITIQNVRTALKRFEKLEFLTDKSTAQGRLITIVNWGKYQSIDSDTNRLTNVDLTDHQQTPNRPLTANNNDNNDNNDNKMIDISSKLQNNNIETEKNDRYRFIERFKELTDQTINYQSILNIPAKSLDLLLKEIEQSEYLKKNLTIQFAIKNIDTILSGKYRDFSRKYNNNKFNNFESTLQEYDLEAIAQRKREEFFKEIGDEN